MSQTGSYYIVMEIETQNDMSDSIVELVEKIQTHIKNVQRELTKVHNIMRALSEIVCDE